MSNDPASSAGRTEPPPEVAVREQLQRLLTSPHLAHSERLARLLRFIVEETLRGRSSELKESRLGLEAFDRPPDSYDPAIDPIVRVQMGRLRAKLRSYYERHGTTDPVLIEVPTGSYVPTFRGRNITPARPLDPQAASPAPVDVRIAVLPFVNMSDDPRNEYFSDGLTEELINLLARDGPFQVVARTSSFQFKGQARDVRDIGRQLEVDKILEGSVRKLDNRVRITAHLINVADGCHLWSERYEREITDIFAIHDDIALAIRQALHARLSGEKGGRQLRGRAGRIDAYNHYLQGRFLWNKRSEEGLRAALDHFQEAIRLEPRFARAHAGVADCFLMLGMSAAEAPGRSMPEAAAAAELALGIDPDLAEAHPSLAAVKNCYEWDRPAAESGYRRAFALDSSYATAHHWYGLFALATSGRLAEAATELEEAIELDPLAQPIIADLGLVHALRRDAEAAVDQCRRVLQADPHFHRPYWFLGLNSAWGGDFAGAERVLRKGLDLCPGRAFRARLFGALGFCYGAWGKRDQAKAVAAELTELAARSYVPPFERAQILAGCGDTDAALACLEEGVATRESYAVFLNVWPSFQGLRSDPRFARMLSRVNPQ